MALFNNFLLFKFTIPYEFNFHDNGLILTFNSQLDEVLDNRLRRFFIYKKEMLVEDQLIPPCNNYISRAKLDGKNILYSYNVSDFEIQLELFDDEIGNIRDYFHRDDHIVRLSCILQNILLVFSFLYNQSMAGKEFFIPFVNNYAPFVARLLTSKDNYKGDDGFISLSYQLDKINNGKIIDIKDSSNYLWKNYFNRAKYSFNLYENLEVILYCSISFESYLTYLIEKNNLKEKYELFKLKSNKKNLNFIKKTQFLVNNSVIDNIKSKDLINSFKMFNNYRNDIVHGDFFSPFIERKKAEKCINSVIDFYNKYEIDKV